MDARFTAEVSAPAAGVFAVVSDLTTYPEWLSIVHRAVPDGEGGWSVEIGARVGPLGRTKRLRMVCCESDAPERVVFERDERDGRPHAAWVLSVGLSGGREPAATRVAVHLHYSGAPTLPLLDAVLAVEARRAAPRLGALAARRAD